MSVRLDQYVAEYWPEYSRSQWQKYIAAGYVTINGEIVTSPKVQLGEDDEVKVDLPTATDYSEHTLPVIYEDDNVCVINKPAGVLTHSKGAVNEEFTVAEFIRPHSTDSQENNRPGIVHRLDRDTSGVIIVAKNGETKGMLQKQFQDRRAKKTYIAVVDGSPKHAEAKIDLPIERNPKKPSTHRVGAGGKSAFTAYRVLASNDKYSVLELKPVTGRTHQLRVHLAHIGTPIVGDPLYGGSKSPLGRLCLHAKSLEITIPQGDRRTFEAEMPEDFQKLIDTISRHG
jgi:23S rRNA pseudouridine1911/1915/1917 synthase